ncbi:LemA family protein [PVC group bacterium]|nr:LemA family protein [PVC group bacterium]
MRKRILIGIIAIFVLGTLLLMGKYNSLVSLQEGISEKWSQVESGYQNRLDLIPNLVSTVMEFAVHETKTLQNVIEARSNVIQNTISAESLKDPQSFHAFNQAQNQLSSALFHLMTVVEKYPNLLTNENFLALQSQLEGAESRINVERKRFNESVWDYNGVVRRFPSNVVASFYGFEENVFFGSKPETAETP